MSKLTSYTPAEKDRLRNISKKPKKEWMPNVKILSGIWNRTEKAIMSQLYIMVRNPFKNKINRKKSNPVHYVSHEIHLINEISMLPKVNWRPRIEKLAKELNRTYGAIYFQVNSLYKNRIDNKNHVQNTDIFPKLSTNIEFSFTSVIVDIPNKKVIFVLTD